jgi:Kelch motif
VYIPNYGSHGILVSLGGATGKLEQPQSNAQAVTTLTGMSTISVFDVNFVFNASDLGGQNGGWFTQGSSGSAVPAPRVDFCAWVATAPDNSSVNIYIYGGWDPTQSETYFDEIWILTLPSFTWILVYKGTAPRFRHTCHALGSGQVITVGGQRYADWSRECDWEYMSVAIYNLNTEQWGSVWNPALPGYQIPNTISQVVGGGPGGGATKLKPDAGWQSVQMAMLFTGTADQTAPAHPGFAISTRKGLSKGVIAAIVVSVVFVLILLLLAVGWVVWHRKHQQARSSDTDVVSDSNAVEPRGESKSGSSILSGWRGWDSNIRP